MATGATPIVVPPDQPGLVQGRPGVVDGQAVCDFVVDASPPPAAGTWRIEVRGLAMNTVACDTSVVPHARNFHAFIANTPGCRSATNGLDWPRL